MQATAAAKKQSQEKPKAYTFSLKTPYMKQGRITQLVAETENMWIHTKINAEGGESETVSGSNDPQGLLLPLPQHRCGKFSRDPRWSGDQGSTSRRRGNARAPRRQASIGGLGGGQNAPSHRRHRQVFRRISRIAKARQGDKDRGRQGDWFHSLPFRLSP